MLITDNSAERSPKAPSVFVLRSAVSAWWECNQKYFYRHAISDSPLLETNNKLKHSLPSVASYSNVCMCLCMDMCTRVHLCARVTPLMPWTVAAGLKYCTMALKFKDRFPEKDSFSSIRFYTSPSFGAWIVWLCPWNWSVGTLAGQGEQTARMPCGFLIAHFSALWFWMGTQRVHSW